LGLTNSNSLSHYYSGLSSGDENSTVLKPDECWPPVVLLKRGQFKQVVNLNKKGLNFPRPYASCYYICYKPPCYSFFNVKLFEALYSVRDPLATVQTSYKIPKRDMT
jgi:hypothetical protein